MARFVFSLERVLEFRRLQQTAEQAELDKLRAELAALAQRKRTLLESAQASRQAIARTGADSNSATLAPVEGYARFVRVEAARIEEDAARLELRIDAQMLRVREATQRCRLLEKLRAKRQAEWSASEAKHLEELAAEAYLARWPR